MIKNKLNLASLCVAFCFFGCGNEAKNDSYFKNLIDNIQKVNYGPDIASDFHTNNEAEFALKLEQEKLKNKGAFNARKQSEKELKNWENGIIKIDYLQEYADVAQVEYNNVPKDKIPPFPTNIFEFLTKDIYTDSSKQDLKPKVLSDSLAFVLASQIVDLMILYPEQFETLKNAFYQTYDKVFKQITGLEINSKEMFESSSKYGYPVCIHHKTFTILIGLSIVAIERYALWGQCINTEKTASLWQIFHGLGSAKDLEKQKDEAYLAFLNAIQKQIQGVVQIFKEYLSPLCVVSDKFDMTKNKAVTIRMLNDFLQNEKDLIKLSESFQKRDNGISLIANSPIFIPQQNNKSVTFNENSIDKGQIQMFNDLGIDLSKYCKKAAQDINARTAKQSQTKPGTTVYQVCIPAIKVS